MTPDYVATVLAQTVESRPFLCPGIRLRLVTPACPLWKARPEDLEALGLPEPFWAFAWAGGQALARFILDNPHVVAGRNVLDFGAGCGLEAIAASLAGAARVRAVDIDPIAVAATRLNASLNAVELEADTENLLGHSLPGYEVILAGDMTYETDMTDRVLTWLRSLAFGGATVLLADPGRGFLDCGGLLEVACYRAPTDVDGDGQYLTPTRILSPRPVLGTAHPK